MATLVHDDVLDEAPLRRGHPTAWSTHGEAIAVATGDYLFARAFAELAALGDPVAIRILSNTSCELALGELLQARAGARSRRLRPRTCSSAAGSRRAACSRPPARSADASAGSTRRRCAALERFGESLGLAFQLADDVLDCAGDPTRTGKALGTDLRDGTTSLPLLLAARSRPACSPAALREPVAARMCFRCSRASPRPARSIRSAILPESYARRAEAELERAPGSDATALRALLQRAIDRDS